MATGYTRRRMTLGQSTDGLAAALALVAALSLAACTQSAALSPTTMPTPPQARTATATATRAAPTPHLTATPVASATAMPAPATPTPTLAVTRTASPTPGPAAITVANAAQVTERDLWGGGVGRDVAWSPSGQEVALAGSQGVYLVDPLGRRLERRLAVGQMVDRVAYSPDGRFLAIGTTRVEIWDLLTGRKALTLPGEIEYGLHSLAFSPGGTWLVAAGITDSGGDPGAREIVWRVADWTIARTWETDFCGAGIEVALSPDGREMLRLWCGRADLVRTATGERTRELPGDGGIRSAVFAPEDPDQVILTDGTDVVFFDVAAQAVVHTLELGDVNGVEVSPTGDALILPWQWIDGERRTRGLVLERESGQVRFETLAVRRAHFSPDGRAIALLTVDGVLQIVAALDGSLILTRDRVPVVQSLTFGPSPWPDLAEVLVTGDDRGRVALIDPDAHTERSAYQPIDQPVTAVALDPTGQRLAVGHWDDLGGGVLVLDAASGRLIRAFSLPARDYKDYRVEALAFSQDGREIAARVEIFGALRAWILETGEADPQPEARLWFHANALGANSLGHVVTLDFVPRDRDGVAGDLILTDRFDGAVLMPAVDAQPTGICQELQRLSQSADGRYLAMGCDQPSLAVWDLMQPGPAQQSRGHAGVGGDGFYGNILAVAFGPYGPLLATAGYDGTLRLWDASTGQPLVVLATHTDGIFALDWSLDGSQLATASWDGTVRLWRLPP